MLIVVEPTVVDACTRTGVGTVPELTIAETRPLESLSLGPAIDAGSKLKPPACVVAVNVTAWLGNGLPATSSTRNVTVELSVKPEPLR